MGNRIKRLLGIMGCAMVLATGFPLGTNGSANAAVITFFTNEAALLAASTTTLIDFEGLVADTGFSSADPQVIGGVTFDAAGGSTTVVCGKDASCNGTPFDSALIVANAGQPLFIDLGGAGSGFTAAGGIFGDINSASSAATLKLFGAGNVLLDTQNVIVGDMGQGLAHTFFGWTVSGDEITRIEYDMVGFFDALDDFRFGLGLAGLGFARRRKMV